jgi:hypothetical protein
MARLLTDEQHTFLAQNVENLYNQELADLVNNAFGLSLTRQQVKSYKRNHKLKSNMTGFFKKGDSPMNKGKKYPGQVNRTTFKKGKVPHNLAPIGTERVTADGYVIVKVSNEGTQRQRWREKHRLIWEAENGQVPAGHCLLFADGNRLNVQLNNILLVSHQQRQQLNKHGLIFPDGDMTRTGLIIADINLKTFELKKKEGAKNG